jgi:hypothetical protein
VHFDEGTVSALPQRFHADGGQGGLDGVAVAARRTQSPGQAFQRMQPHLAQSLTLVLHPVVVPVRQKFAGQVGHLERTQVSAHRWRPDSGELTGERDQLTHVDLDVVIEAQGGRGGRDHLLTGLVDPPERGPQTGE